MRKLGTYRTSGCACVYGSRTGEGRCEAGQHMHDKSSRTEAKGEGTQRRRLPKSRNVESSAVLFRDNSGTSGKQVLHSHHALTNQDALSQDAHLYPQNSTLELVSERSQCTSRGRGASATHFFISIQRSALPSVCDSSCIWYVAADKSAASAPWSCSLEMRKGQWGEKQCRRTILIFGAGSPMVAVDRQKPLQAQARVVEAPASRRPRDVAIVCVWAESGDKGSRGSRLAM